MDIEKIKKEIEAVERMAAGLRAKRKPNANRLSMLSRVPLDYRYLDAGRDKRGSRVFFCRATKTNVAGFYLCWKLTVPSRTGRKRVRSHICAADSTSKAKEICQRRCDAFRKKREAEKRAKAEQPGADLHAVYFDVPKED